MNVQVDAVKEALAELADRSYQERVWLASSGEVSSPVEVFSQLYDDSGLGHALGTGNEVFSSSLDEDLVLLEKLLTEATDGSPHPADLLDQDSMALIRELAASALFALVRLSANPSAPIPD